MKNFLKKTFIYELLNDFRAWKAKKSMLVTNLYPYESNEIISDYRYSIKKDFRTLMQVINIESCIKYIKKIISRVLLLKLELGLVVQAHIHFCP